MAELITTFKIEQVSLNKYLSEVDVLIKQVNSGKITEQQARDKANQLIKGVKYGIVENGKLKWIKDLFQ